MAVLIAALVCAGLVTPALGASVNSKSDVKALAKKQIPKTGNHLFLEEDELVRYGPIRLNVGQGAPVGAFGPFRLSAHCDEVDDAGDGPPLEERGRIMIQSTQADAAFRSNVDVDNDLDPPDVGVWAVEDADTPGLQTTNSENYDNAHASAVGGTRIASTSNAIALNQGGFDCTFFGSTLILP
jgi:hypothetical protein